MKYKLLQTLLEMTRVDWLQLQQDLLDIGIEPKLAPNTMTFTVKYESVHAIGSIVFKDGTISLQLGDFSSSGITVNQIISSIANAIIDELSYAHGNHLNYFIKDELALKLVTELLANNKQLKVITSHANNQESSLKINDGWSLFAVSKLINAHTKLAFREFAFIK